MAKTQNAAEKPETVKFDIKGYQKRLAQHGGAKEVSRNYVATLIGEPAAKLVAWDKRGTIPAEVAVKFVDLEERVTSGKTKLEPPKRGTKPGSKRKAKAPRAARKASPKAAKVARASGGAAQGAVDVRKLRESSGLSLAAFGKAMGVSIGTVQNWQKGGSPRPEALARLRAFAAKATGGSGASAPSSASPAPAAKSHVDVKKLRTSLGLSRADFSKQVGGASLGAIANWETGKSVPASKYTAKLKALVARVRSGAVSAAAPVAKAGQGRANAAAPASATSHMDHKSLARVLFETAFGCSDNTRDRLLAAASALLGE